MANLVAFAKMATGEITSEEFRAIQKESQRAENKKVLEEVERQYGSMDNYRHARAIELCSKNRGAK